MKVTDNRVSKRAQFHLSRKEEELLNSLVILEFELRAL
jgi:hypothetical protein